MLQNATFLRKSAPWPTNISDEDVSCTAPATRKASFQILFKCPTPAIVFGNATKPSHFADFCQGAACHARRHLNLQKRFKHVVLYTFWLRNVLRATTACTFPTSQLPSAFRGWRACTFWLRSVLRATTACTFWTSQLPGVLRTRQSLTLLTSKTCFSPQRRALFRHLNFQKWSGPGVLCTCWLANVLRAATACNFSSLIWPAGSAPAALASLLFDLRSHKL